MNLRVQAELDLGEILENKDDGFGWDIIVTDPAGTTETLVGSSGDISQVIDPDTGAVVSGRMAHVSLRISSLAAVGLGIPRGIESENSKPWVIQFLDTAGSTYTFKVIKGNPDRTLGMVSCLLGKYSG